MYEAEVFIVRLYREGGAWRGSLERVATGEIRPVAGQDEVASGIAWWLGPDGLRLSEGLGGGIGQGFNEGRAPSPAGEGDGR
ncbi:MAG: hypothetical protein ACRD0L_03515 [Acidimicrobiales bacterium]